MKAIYFLLLLCLQLPAFATTYHVGINGSGHPYSKIKMAAAAAQPGDTILLHGGVYDSENVGETISNLHGTPSAWYYILAAPGENVYIEGNHPEGLKLTECSYIHISGLRFRSTGWGNMVNIDDGGTYNTPTHNIIIENCIFKDIIGTGNCDILKLTGLDTFIVRNCRFYEGAYGDGAGIDMNGCHEGVIEDNYFEYPGRFAFQVKGGCHKIRFRRNFIQARPYKPIACERAAHIGGSHGGPFRPANANYNASDIWVYSNIFSGGDASIAFVGAVNSHVINNTFYQPEEWIMRILQEQNINDAGTTLLPCGNNTFRNNIIYLHNQMNQFGEFNVGGNVNLSSFRFSHNLWYRINSPGWTGPSNMPVTDSFNLVGPDPMFLDAANYKFDLLGTSPAIAKGKFISEVLLDFNKNSFLANRSIGAIEGGVTTGMPDPFASIEASIYPVPANEEINISLSETLNAKIELLDITGNRVLSKTLRNGKANLNVKHLLPGIYIMRITDPSGIMLQNRRVVISH